jgi:putative endonuclease
VVVSNDARQALGRRGEELAAGHLRKLGFVVLARNVRTRHGEIDLIARRATVLVFVEVKTRRVGARQHRLRDDQLPLSGLGARQRLRLRRLAGAWLAEQRGGAVRGAPTIRLDAIGVVIDTDGCLRQIDHLEGAW